MRNIHLSQIKNYHNNILFEYNKLTKTQPIDKIKELCNIFNSESTSDNKIISPSYILEYLKNVKFRTSEAHKQRLDTSKIIDEYILNYNNFEKHMKEEISEMVDGYLGWTYENKQTYLLCYTPINNTEEPTIIKKSTETLQSDVIDTTHFEIIDTTQCEIIDTTQCDVIDTTQCDVIDTMHIEVIDTTQCDVIDISQSDNIDNTQSNITDTMHTKAVYTTHKNDTNTFYGETIDNTQSDVIYTTTNENKKQIVSKNKITKRNIKKDIVQKKKVVVKRKTKNS